MKCYKHNDRNIQGICVTCGKMYCDECIVEVNGKYQCKECISNQKQGIKEEGPRTSKDNFIDFGVFCCVMVAMVILFPMFLY